MSCVMCPAETFQKAEFSRFLAVRSNTNMLCPVKYPNIPLNTTSRPDFSVAQVGMYADMISQLLVNYLLFIYCFKVSNLIPMLHKY